AVVAVSLVDERRELLGALLARALFVEAEAQKDGAAGPEASAEEQFDGFELGDEEVPAVGGTATPDVLPVVGAAPWWVFPGAESLGGNWDGVLVGHQEVGFEGLIGALPCVQQTVAVDFFDEELLMNQGEGG